jgi:nucleoside-diphosphate-sugar epimerase
VLRPAGLVGGDRHPAKFLAGRKGVGGRLYPVNLVHRTDLIAITSALLETSCEEKVFHAVAGSHPEKEAYYRTMAEKMGLEKPEFDPSDDSRGKLVRGERTKEWLEVKFRYDDPFSMD